MKRSLLNKDLQSQAEFIVENKVITFFATIKVIFLFLIKVMPVTSGVKIYVQSIDQQEPTGCLLSNSRISLSDLGY